MNTPQIALFNVDSDKGNRKFVEPNCGQSIFV